MTTPWSPEADAADAALMSRVQADVPEAFGALYDRFGAQALGLASASTRDATRAEDIVQDAFLTVWRKRAQYRADRGSVGGWIMGVVRNRAIDAHRRQARHDTRRAEEHRADDQRTGAWQERRTVEDSVGEREEASRLRSVLARLPASQRDVITLAYFGELSASEISTHMALPLGTVKGRMRLGLDKLRTGLAEDEQAPDERPPSP